LKTRDGKSTTADPKQCTFECGWLPTWEYSWDLPQAMGIMDTLINGGVQYPIRNNNDKILYQEKNSLKWK